MLAAWGSIYRKLDPSPPVHPSPSPGGWSLIWKGTHLPKWLARPKSGNALAALTEVESRRKQAGWLAGNDDVGGCDDDSPMWRGSGWVGVQV